MAPGATTPHATTPDAVTPDAPSAALPSSPPRGNLDAPVRTGPVDVPSAEYRALDRVAAQVERRTGRALPTVQVDRHPTTAAALRPARALAAARGTTVVLPLTAGPLVGARAGSLLAHELTHVAQQAAGYADEALAEHQARHAEQAAGGRSAPRTAGPVTARATTTTRTDSTAQRSSVATLLRRAARASLPAQPPPASAALSTAPAAPAPAAEAPAQATPAHAAPAATAPAPTPPSAAVQLATPDPVRSPATLPDRAQARVDVLGALRESDLDELASRLYERLRSDLRSELLADRDRVSDLTDLWT